MENEVKYMTFYENWVELMEECTPEEWYELCKIITNLRFKGIDTDTKTIRNLKIRMAWTLIRPSIKKSNRNTRYNNKSKAEKTTNLTASNTPNDISNQTTKNNGSESLKMTNTNEFAIPTEIDDTAEYYNEWTDQCWSLIKAAKLDYMNGDYDAIKECNIRLQALYDQCIASGCSEEKLLSIRCTVEKEINEEIEKEYNRRIA